MFHNLARKIKNMFLIVQLRRIPSRHNLALCNLSKRLPTDQFVLTRKCSSQSSSSVDGDVSPGPVIDPPLYPSHIETTWFQKSLLAAGSAVMCLAAPWRDDMICTFGETTGPVALKSMYKKMWADPIGKQILQERPRINTSTVDLDYLQSLPRGTFGKEYSIFLNKHDLDPDARRPVQFIDDPELAYVMQRYREVHDLMHTILGMPTNMLGEIVVKWFEGLQTGLPLCVTGGLFGPVRLGPKHFQKYIETHMWWAIRNGQNAKFMLNIYYEKHWEQNLADLRKEMNIETPPATPAKMKPRALKTFQQ